ncbi:hypothetical protein [Streptomyces sp. RerS4]|uniref:hypothetical protein n=1 Tax=Streptomyces sp. RerS4 TaxID=2942449 RepID=UPI00201BD908|nr:hypothetical protein [Streptomyces sp. RerS4]UQX01248.1 hypothetical protein M4D82_12460 [Streptomyces sp. RerS4]
MRWNGEIRGEPGRRGRGRAVRLGALAAVIWLAVELVGRGPFGPPAAVAQAGCAGRLVKVLPFSTGEVRVRKTRTQVCATAVALRPGERRAMWVSVQPRGGIAVGDAGQFTRYAGPVTVGAINRCVYVRGGIAAGSVESGWILC